MHLYAVAALVRGPTGNLGMVASLEITNLPEQEAVASVRAKIEQDNPGWVVLQQSVCAAPDDLEGGRIRKLLDQLVEVKPDA